MLKHSKNIIILFLLFNAFAFGNLIRPIHSDELNYIHVLFEWEQEPDVLSYNLQVSTDQTFNNIILDIDEISTVYIDVDHLNWDDIYFWRVRPILNCDTFAFPKVSMRRNSISKLKSERNSS